MIDKIFFVHRELGMMVDLETIQKFAKQQITMRLEDANNPEKEYRYKYRDIPVSDDWMPMVDSIIGGKENE